MKHIYSTIMLLVLFVASFATGAEIIWNFDDIPVSKEYVSFLSTPGYSSDGFSISGVHKTTGKKQTFSYRGTVSALYHGQELSTSTSYKNVIRSEDGLPFDIRSIKIRGGINKKDVYPDITLFLQQSLQVAQQRGPHLRKI